jgi:hypothetical protein
MWISFLSYSTPSLGKRFKQALYRLPELFRHATSYGVYISQLVHFSTSCNNGKDFNECMTENHLK